MKQLVTEDLHKIQEAQNVKLTSMEPQTKDKNQNSVMNKNKDSYSKNSISKFYNPLKFD
jgi:hypothetical protein